MFYSILKYFPAVIGCFLVFLGGCSVGSITPATDESDAAQQVLAVEDVQTLSGKIEGKSLELISLVDESRRRVKSGTSTTDVEIAKMRALMAEIEVLNTELQLKVSEIESNVTKSAKSSLGTAEATTD